MATDGHVSARTILRAVAELEREGVDRALCRLEQAEPDLAEFLLEHTTLLHRDLLALGGPAKRTQRAHRRVLSLALTCVEALRRGHYELWQREHGPPDGEDGGGRTGAGEVMTGRSESADAVSPSPPPTSPRDG